MSVVVPIAPFDVANFASSFVPRWLQLARDQVHGGIVDRLALDGRPAEGDAKTTLVHARLAFTLAHLHLAIGDQRLLDAAIDTYRFLDERLRDADGGYRFSVSRDGQPLADPMSQVRRTYDQSFVLLALVTLRKAAPDSVSQHRIDECWDFIAQRLTDPGTGALWEDDVMAAAGAKPGDLRAQNPHMHMFEALLQAFEMTGDRVWLERAAAMLDVGRRFFIDETTGAVREFVGHDLEPLAGTDGERREPGHQYEWAWLLHRYADLAGVNDARSLADPMITFVERHGLTPRSGPLDGLPFDALDARGQVTETTHLLWPLTEAGKFYAARHARLADTGDATRARGLASIMARHFFAPATATGLPVWVNRLDADGRPVWSEALSRLLYHVAIFVTEGARAGLWTLTPLPSPTAENH
jgi:mannose/cellobiose epimerase-like protein (N-acyl-D-glucosamine 2-epimerase family)